MVVSEIPTQTEASETVMAVSEMAIPEVLETVIPEVSEIHSLMVDSVTLRRKQDLITIISNHNQDITIITEASDLMIQEVSDRVVASTRRRRL